jgi:hypothetical protein
MICEGHAIEYIPLVTRTPMALEIDRRDLPNRVNYEAVCSLASVSGGFANTASGEESSVNGGVSNTASGAVASVSGGDGNMASGERSSVSGGLNRTASELFNWAAGALFSNF